MNKIHSLILATTLLSCNVPKQDSAKITSALFAEYTTDICLYDPETRTLRVGGRGTGIGLSMNIEIYDAQGVDKFQLDYQLNSKLGHGPTMDGDNKNTLEAQFGLGGPLTGLSSVHLHVIDGEENLQTYAFPIEEIRAKSQSFVATSPKPKPFSDETYCPHFLEE